VEKTHLIHPKPIHCFPSVLHKNQGGGFNQIEKIVKIGSFPQVGMNIKTEQKITPARKKHIQKR